ncbi:MAG: STAS domain-containing protein [Pseudomonadota bacterium]
MKLTVEKTDDGQGAIVTFVEDHLDAGNVKAFKDGLQPILDAHQAVLIDMSPLNFVDSSGLGALLSCLRAMNKKEGQLKLFALTKPVQTLFELVRMHRIFAIYNSREEALATR